MADLNGMSMQDFDVVEKQVDQTWIQFTIQWGTAPYVQVANSVNLDTGYLWTGSHLPGFANDTYYMALLSLEDTQARIQIFNLNQDNFALTPSQGLTAAQLTVGNTINAIPMTGNTKIPAGIVEVSDGINSQLFVTLTGAAALSSSLPIVPTAPIYAFPTGSVISVSSAPPSTFFDTGIINDSYQFIRRPGRIGWQATFNDGDASLRSIRPESLVFAEYQSSVMASNTPVQAARLYAQFTPNTQMWQFFTALSSDGVEGPIISGSIPEPPPSNELYPFEGLYPSQGLYPF